MSETEPRQAEFHQILVEASLFEPFPKNMSLEEKREIRAKYDGTIKLDKAGVLGVKIIVDNANGFLRRAEIFELDSGELDRVYQPFTRNRWSSRVGDLSQGSSAQERMNTIFEYVHGKWQEMKKQPCIGNLPTREWSVPKKDPLTIILPSEPVQEIGIKPKRLRPKRVLIKRTRKTVQNPSLEVLTRDDIDIWAKEEIERMNRDRKSSGIESEEI